MTDILVRQAVRADRPNLRLATVELQEHERRLHSTRLPGEEMADANLDWMLGQAARSGATLVAEIGGAFAGFASGWVEQSESLAETPDSKRHGFVSDVCVLPAFRRRGVALRLLSALEAHLARSGVSRIRLSALAANAAARAAYENAGYAPYEVVYEKIVSR